MSLLEVHDLRVAYDVRDAHGRAARLRAVDGVSLAVEPGESVGVVGESGCGKTTLGQAVLRLVPIASGRVVFDGEDVSALRGANLKRFRRRAQMVFQDPFGSLNPRLSVGGAIEEVLAVHRLAPRRDRRSRARDLFRQVGLDPVYVDRYPHEFSGGQRQRIGIARALALDPALIIADEPVSALDVSVQVQILNLMKDLQSQRGLAYLFIAHDLAVVRYMCRRILVMYLGVVMESGGGDELFRRPAHPYTEALISAVPDVDRGLEGGDSRRIILKGDVPSAMQVPSGCRFHPRCPRAEAICASQAPEPREVSPGHRSACHFAERLFASSAGAATGTGRDAAGSPPPAAR